MLYSYEAKDSQGKRVSGTVEAPDERGAARHVQAEGYFLMRLNAAPATAGSGGSPVAGGDIRIVPPPSTIVVPPPLRMSPGTWLLSKIVYPIWTGVSLRDMSVLYRQFSAMLDAGVPIQRIMGLLQSQTPNGVLRRCMVKIADRVNAGGTISDGMSEYPWIFPEYQRAAVVAGEAIGNLDQQFRRLAQALEDEYRMRATIKREMFLPCINLSALFLLPPLVFLFFGNYAEYIRQAFYPLGTTIGVIFGFYVVCRLASGVRWFYDAVLASFPGIGGAVRMIAFARFGRTMAAMYAAGVNIVSAVHYSVAASGNTYLGGRMQTIGPMLEMGMGVTEAFHRTGIFPPMVISMIGTGEETGNVDSMMDKMASFYEEEAKFKLHQLCVALGAITAIAVGIRILIIIVKFYTSLYGGMMQQMD
ncbi:MAG: type II secretion system F family protein [Capsulimonas sp.]|uniref:type II secretion system F family protein n=1 Tax=Capsulimonas sp. TaxID=2494211 RepID=UPI003267F4ED